MRVFIVYCHPSDDSFTKNMCDAFIKGITDSGNEYIISDLYKMDFDPNMTEKEYLRVTGCSDVLKRWNLLFLTARQEKMNFAKRIGI